MRFYDPTTLQRKDLENDSDNVIAILESGFLPSVTTILSIIRMEYLEHWFIRKSLEYYQRTGDMVQAIEYRDTTAAQFGSVCHALLESHLTAAICNVDHDERHIRSIQPLLRWIDQHVDEVIFCEQPFADEEFGYAGTADFLFQLKGGRLMLGDVKCKRNSTKFPMSPDIMYKYQLSAYRQHFEKQYSEIGIANFLLATPSRFSSTPLLRVFDYDDGDWTKGFNAAHHLWLDQFYS